MKKFAEDIIILHKYTKNHYQPQKRKFQNNEKKNNNHNNLEVSSFHTSALKIMIICYTVPWMSCVTDFSFLAIFCPFTPLTAQKKQNFKKKKQKKPLEI